CAAIFGYYFLVFNRKVDNPNESGIIQSKIVESAVPGMDLAAASMGTSSTTPTSDAPNSSTVTSRITSIQAENISDTAWSEAVSKAKAFQGGIRPSILNPSTTNSAATTVKGTISAPPLQSSTLAGSKHKQATSTTPTVSASAESTKKKGESATKSKSKKVHSTGSGASKNHSKASTDTKE